MTNLDSILKSKDITFLTNVCILKAMVFPAVMYECKSWTMKKAERRRIDAFKLWCWRRLLRVPWTARRSNQSILKGTGKWKWLSHVWLFVTPWSSPGQNTGESSHSLKSTLNVHWKDWCWSWRSNTLATWCKEPTHWKIPWCCERLKAKGEASSRGWGGYIASPTQWTWIWANSGR